MPALTAAGADAVDDRGAGGIGYVVCGCVAGSVGACGGGAAGYRGTAVLVPGE